MAKYKKLKLHTITGIRVTCKKTKIVYWVEIMEMAESGYISCDVINMTISLSGQSKERMVEADGETRAEILNFLNINEGEQSRGGEPCQMKSRKLKNAKK